MKKDVFISYSTKDRPLAESLVNFLEGHGFSCFISSRDIPLGATWTPYIIDALEEIKVMVILFTENYNKSVQVDREITVCCDLEKKPVIPLKLSEEPLTGIKKFYLSNINWIDFKGEKEQYDILLKSIIINIGKEAEPNDETKLILDESTYKVHCGKEITPQMIFEAVEIDKLVYNDSYIGNYDNCVKWWKKNKYIYVMLEDIKTKKIIGYINAMPINNTLYEIIKKGEIIDVTINDENIETYDLPDTYNLYISSVALHPKYHNSGAFKLLYDALILLIIELFKREIYFSKVIADAVSPIGEKLCKYIGMVKCEDSKHQSKIFEGSLLPINIRYTTRLSKKLFDLYKTLNL